MKRYLALIGVVFFATVVSAYAQQATLSANANPAPTMIKPALSVRQALEIAGALAQMNCENRILKDGAKETLQCVPFGTKELPFDLALRIARNQDKVKVVVETYNRSRNVALAAADRKGDGNLTEKASSEFLVEDAKRLESSSGITLERFKQSEIEALHLMPGVIAALLPIVDEK